MKLTSIDSCRYNFIAGCSICTYPLQTYPCPFVWYYNSWFCTITYLWFKYRFSQDQVFVMHFLFKINDDHFFFCCSFYMKKKSSFNFISMLTVAGRPWQSLREKYRSTRCFINKSESMISKTYIYYLIESTIRFWNWNRNRVGQIRPDSAVSQKS